MRVVRPGGRRQVKGGEEGLALSLPGVQPGHPPDPVLGPFGAGSVIQDRAVSRCGRGRGCDLGDVC